MNKIDQGYRNLIAQKLQMEVDAERREAAEWRAHWPDGSPGVVTAQKNLANAIERRDAVLTWLDTLINEREAHVHGEGA